MSFTPVLPFGGFNGWAFLQRTKADQQAVFDRTPQNQRLADHARERLASVGSAEELVSDRRLLTVALGAFGLDEEINNRFFIRKVLESPRDDEKALANRLSDKRFQKLSQAFGFGEAGGPPPRSADFAEKLVTAWQTRSFEIAVGESDNTMRLAMNAERELGELAASTSGKNVLWYTIMGNPPLRTVFEGALNLPTSFGRLPVERQLDDLKTRARRMFGSDEVAQFADPAKREALVRKFILRSEAQATATNINPMSQSALMLLQTGIKRNPLI